MFPIEWANDRHGYYVIFSQSAIDKMLFFRQLDVYSMEAGGVLVGYRRVPHLEVIDVTTPGPKDFRARARFKRRDPSHKRFAHQHWMRSGRLIDYLGEWHTHPEQHPSPSWMDIGECIRTTLRYPRKPILEVVIGTSTVWVGTYGVITMEPLKPIAS